jgi:hypothetical protein
MKPTLTAPPPLTLAETRTRFERWRRERPPGGRIPFELWEAAVDLVPQHGPTAVSRALRLGYAELKRRCEASAGGALPAGEPSSVVSFVALPPGLVSRHEPLPTCLEITNAQGATLRLTLGDARQLDPTMLVRAFLQGAL